MTQYDVIDITTQIIITFSSKRFALHYMNALKGCGHIVVANAYRNTEGRSIFLGEINNNF